MNEDPNVVTLRSTRCFVRPAQPRDSNAMAGVPHSAISGKFDKLEVRVLRCDGDNQWNRRSK